MVIWQNEVRGVADEQVFLNLHAAFAETFDFADERHWVEHDAIGDHAGFGFAENAGGNEVENIFLTTDDDRVSGIVAALAADDDVSFISEEVDDFSFTFIAPLGADENSVWHKLIALL